MSGFMEMMTAPMLVSLVLVAMHGYLGTHVVKRGVIFVDIALAQMAAFGVAVALIMGAEVGQDRAYLAGLISTLLGALILVKTRSQNSRIPQEAYIGIVYVVFSAAMILLLTRLPHGTEEVNHLLVGSILWVRWPVVIKTVILYGILGGVMFAAHGRLSKVTDDPRQAQAQGMSLARWDFFFYLVVGLVVTSSVQIAGVLLVFTLLVVPSVMAIRLFRGGRAQFLWILAVGSLSVICGSALSYGLDLPTGAAIVCTFGGALGVQILVEGFLRR